MTHETFVSKKNLQDILDGIEQKIAGLGSTLTGIYTWQANNQYKTGDVCILNGSLFICLATHTSSPAFSTDIANWNLVYSDIDEWASSTYYVAGASVIANNAMYKCKTTHTSGSTFDSTEEANWDVVVGTSGNVKIKNWATTTQYKQYDVVMVNNNLYRCVSNHTSTTFSSDISNWELIYASIGNWQASTYYPVGVFAVNDKKLYKCKTQHTSGSTFSDTNWDLLGGSSIDTWQASTAYNVGDLVIESNVLYQCKTAHTSGSTFSDTNWNKIDGGITIQPYEDTPIGTVISYMGTTAPEEYLACDGTVYNINDYWELADFINAQFGSKNFFGGDGTITFAVPDLRGEFLRGAGTNSHANNGNGASVGVHQDGTQYNNIYGDGVGSVVMPGTGVDTSNDRLNGNNYNIDKYITKYGAPKLRYTGFNSATTSGMNSHYTSRPTNTSVLYCIKYTNAPSMQPSNIYSTTEKRIGTWIDGKPLYQKTYTGTIPTGADSANVNIFYDSTTIGSADTIFISEGYIEDIASYGITHQINTVDYGSPVTFYSSIFVSTTYNTIRGRVTSRFIGNKITVTIKYTKT